jgi:hypothetical protein
MADPADKQLPRVNTGAHEQMISEACKQNVPALLDLTAAALQKSIDKVTSEDPLHAERYIHLADQLTGIADRLYHLGESARARAQEAYATAKGENG